MSGAQFQTAGVIMECLGAAGIFLSVCCFLWRKRRLARELETDYGKECCLRRPVKETPNILPEGVEPLEPESEEPLEKV